MDGPGRPASDPRVLLGLWMLATVEGIGSARRLARLTEEHDVYRWLRGGVPVNYHLLSDFRVAHQKELDELLTQTIALLMSEQLVTLKRVAQDGVRVRAAAGSGSFRRRATLERCLTEAREQVERLASEREAPDVPDAKTTRQQQVARERAARERLDRVERALEALPALEAIKEQQRKKLSKERQARVKEARASTTDPEARVMKMGDGGFRPALNIQLATDGDSRAILGVEVSQQGSDGGLVAPMEAQVAERTDRHPDEYLMDGGLVTRDDITTLAAHDVTVYAPVEPPRTKTSGRTAYDPRPDDTPAVAEWRQRMGTDDGKAIYRQRSGIAEWTNAPAPLPPRTPTLHRPGHRPGHQRRPAARRHPQSAPLPLPHGLSPFGPSPPPDLRHPGDCLDPAEPPRLCLLLWLSTLGCTPSSHFPWPPVHSCTSPTSDRRQRVTAYEIGEACRRISSSVAEREILRQATPASG